MGSHFSFVQLCVALWTVARQAPLSRGFSRQDYWSVLPCPPPRDLPDPGIELHLVSSIAARFFSTSTTRAMAPHSSTLAWKIPWMEEPGGLQSMGSLGVRPDWATSLSLFTFTFHFHALETEIATHSSVLAWRIPGTGEPGRLPSMGSHRVGYDWSDWAAAAAAAPPGKPDRVC